jgi:DNA invertase Pin-like site-specific DNA recombinase
MDSKVKFVCADMPFANEFSIHIFAALAQQERKMISERTKAALKALKERGVRLGSPKLHLLGGPVAIKNSRNKHIENRTTNQNNIVASAMVRTLREKGLTFEKIADTLNEEGFKSSKGGVFYPMQCYRLFNYDKNK